ncbi:hypothetical protein EBL_c04100 [Shimwellia blattae DSM 4481 = NBRC 105725]|uniref:Uncharacterized protein n=1 Tax=Shimwellia blattae (strain ATCC 29907 / DSM 4481 / JCM 1650 / NBRC 105725 / CDC 9005-74) TaxID=630626 RepID=I2B4T3_SHIBC|nr:hypothetical protein EBL_c04100 [Shimwellia blattae DSM 4481 = NBRC 105725]
MHRGYLPRAGVRSLFFNSRLLPLINHRMIFQIYLKYLFSALHFDEKIRFSLLMICLIRGRNNA